MTKSRDKGRVVTTMKRAATVRRWAQMPGPSSHTYNYYNNYYNYYYNYYYYYYFYYYVRRWAKMPGPSSHTWRYPSMTSTHF